MGSATGPTLIRGARQLLTVRGAKAPRRGNELDDVGLISDGAVLLRDGRIVEAGPSRRLENLAEARGAAEINAAGRVVMPGFIDSHTHLLFPPRDWRHPEGNPLRLIHGTSARVLEMRAQVALDAMARHGPTTVEVKTGCGPDEAAEIKVIRVLSSLRGGAVELIPTFLLRIPPGFSEADGVALATDFAARIQRRAETEFADIWWDGSFPRVSACARFIEGAAALGLGCKLHAAGPSPGGAIALAIGYRTVSVDHLEHINEGEARLLAKARTIATLMPLHIEKGGPTPPARSLVEAGAAIALATDYNPRDQPDLSMQAVVALACARLGLTPAEAIAAGTINAAHALGCADRSGSIEPGKAADLLLLNTDDYRDMARCLGVNLVHLTVKRGEIVYREGDVRMVQLPM